MKFKKNTIILVIGLLLILLEMVLYMTTTINEKETREIQVTRVKTTQTTTTTKQTIKTTKKVVKKKTNKKVKKVVKKENKEEYKKYAYNLVVSYGWSEEDYNNLVKLWNRESGWSIYAKNKSCLGIPQACPGSKMKKSGNDYATNYQTQIRWGLSYIKARYGNPTKAWEHSQRTRWY